MSGNQTEETTSHKINIPFSAYTGDEPYIFISYKHADSDLVYPVIKRIHDEGFHIWYDAALPYGKNYDIQIANRIKNSSLFVNFITKTSMACANDEEDYLIKEFSFARNFKKNIFPIYLEDVELDGYYLVHLLDKQSIFRHEYGGDDEMFINACIEALINDFNINPEDFKDYENDSPSSEPQQIPVEDERLENEYLKEFDRLNTTTESIFELEENNVLIILRDGKNLTDWRHVADRKKVIYVIKLPRLLEAVDF